MSCGRASSGQGKNQSIVVQFTKAGNVTNRFLNSALAGENDRTICNFYLHYLTKN